MIVLADDNRRCQKKVIILIKQKVILFIDTIIYMKEIDDMFIPLAF